MKEFSIFLSYKDDDGKRAEAFRDEFVSFAERYINTDELKCKVFLARDPDCLRGGEHWRQIINERIRQTDVFILFFTTTNADWQWCLYEAGLFASETSGAADRLLVCLHTSKLKVPSPLDHLQAVEVKDDRVQAVIHAIISRVGLSKVPNIRYSSDLENLVAAAEKVFEPYQIMVKRRLLAPRSLLPRMTVRFELLQLSQPDAAEHWSDSTEMTVNSGGSSIFGIPAHVWVDYTDFETQVVTKKGAEESKKLLDSLRLVLQKVVEDQFEKPSNAVVIAATDPADHRRVYRMLVTDLRSCGAHLEFDISFIEVMDDPDGDDNPLLNQLFKMIRVLHSFRVEIKPELTRLASIGDPLILTRESARLMNNSRAQFEQFDMDRLRAIHREMARDISADAAKDKEEWARIWQSVDHAQQQGQAQMSRADAERLIDLNLKWLRFYARRYFCLVSECKDSKGVQVLSALLRNDKKLATRVVGLGREREQDLLHYLLSREFATT